ncbi:MAG: hypothetical protein NC432_09535 [Roseburia sp.]|nr:hypothetical protein [Roseburia sp.]MCM1098219.1 hypothetical protein [Ruminococcus flavefaciens]
MRKDRNIMTCVSLALCGALLLPGQLTVSAAESGKTYEEYLAGTKTERAELEYTQIHIATEEDLVRLAADCELDSWSVDKYVLLDGDIVLKEHRDLMIPGFGGIFDGCGYQISNLETEASGSAIGLFRYIREGAVVRNLRVSGRVHPQGSQTDVGLLAGVNYGEIRSCSATGSVTGEETVGGLVGVNRASGEIRGCSAAVLVAGDHCVGGICGANYGTLNNCSNEGKINAYSREVTYRLDDLTMENLENLNDMSNIGARTDTGGIVGYSEGKIYFCTNTGTVGYPHVGYNTGGIVGRLHQGYLQSCTNTGDVYGRKDVGGIAGQMEPFLEIRYLSDKLDEIDREAETLLELMDAAHQDLNRYGRQTSELAGSLTTRLRNISDTASYLTGTANELWYIYNQELTGIGSDIKRLNTDLQDANQENSIPQNTFPGNLGDYTVSGGDAGNISSWFPIDLDSYQAALRRFGDSTASHIANMTTASSDRSGGINGNLEFLNREMENAVSDLQQLSDLLLKETDQVGGDVDAVAAQARILHNSIRELRDDLFRYEGISVEDASDEAAGQTPAEPGAEQEKAYYDTSSFQQGKITLCVNKGNVTADTAVGGIVGQVATEYDFDPEDDIELTGEESFHIEQTVKAIVRESANFGEITGKKDYAGGIVGKADFGAIISCESYGAVSSAGGSYVGGIAGASGYAVRSCSFLGNISGKNYVGGIVGRGCDLFGCYAYPELLLEGEYGGSIAGQIDTEGILRENYYVRGGIAGVDNVGYEGGAAPVEYEELCRMESVPTAFREFTVIFRADGQELAVLTCQYGDVIEEAQIPQIPEKEGCYGVWPDLEDRTVRRNRILDAQYQPWISTLAGAEKDESGKSLVLVQGSFRPGAELSLTEEEEGQRLQVVYRDEAGLIAETYGESVTVRVLCEEPERMSVELYENGSWTQKQTSVIGSYVEFILPPAGIYRVTPLSNGDNRLRIGIAVGGCAVLAAALLGGGLRRRKRKKPA